MRDKTDLTLQYGNGNRNREYEVWQTVIRAEQ